MITFDGRTFEKIEQVFRESVDDYPAFCAARGERPDRPWSSHVPIVRYGMQRVRTPG